MAPNEAGRGIRGVRGVASMSANEIRAICDRVHDTLHMAEPSPAGQSLDGGTNRDRLPYNPRLLEATSDLHATLSSWARMIAEEKPSTVDCDDNPTSVAGWIWGHAEWLAQHPAADDFTQEVTDTLTPILHSIDRGDDRIFLGIHAGIEVWAKPGQKTVLLPGGESRTVEEVRGWMKRQTLDHQGTAREVAIILKEVHGLDISPKRITAYYREDTKAREQGRIGKHEGLDHAAMDGKRPVFVVDEVLSRISREARRVA